MTEIDRLRESLAALHAGQASGEIPRRVFERQAAERGLDLARAVVRSTLQPGEQVVAEHHVVHAHLRLAESVLREPDQEVVSLFATDRRLLRLTSRAMPEQPATFDHRDRTEVSELGYPQIARLVRRRQIRWGEVAAGAVIVGVALALRDALQVTGPLLIVLGVLGVLHGWLLPTRWVSIDVEDPTRPPWRVSAVGRRTGRQLLAAVREHLAAMGTLQVVEGGAGGR